MKFLKQSRTGEPCEGCLKTGVQTDLVSLDDDEIRTLVFINIRVTLLAMSRYQHSLWLCNQCSQIRGKGVPSSDGVRPPPPRSEWKHANVPPQRRRRRAVPEAYAVLKGTPSMSLEELRDLYRKAIFQAHPDRGGSHERATVVNSAWEWIEAHHEVRT